MIDLCKIFGVEEGEEFRISTFKDIYKIHDGLLFNKCPIRNIYVEPAEVNINDISGLDIYKLPKKKEFTDDELAIMRSLPKEYKWIARDNSYDGNNTIYVFCEKPKKETYMWDADGCHRALRVFNHIFKNLKWEDEEPVFIDDYVERGAE